MVRGRAGRFMGHLGLVSAEESRSVPRIHYGRCQALLDSYVVIIVFVDGRSEAPGWPITVVPMQSVVLVEKSGEIDMATHATMADPVFAHLEVAPGGSCSA
jgi:hypothetical protein